MNRLLSASGIRTTLAAASVLCIVLFVRAQDVPVGPPVDPSAAPAAGPAAPATPAAEGPISTRSLLGIMHDGGPLMYPIALCSVVMLIFVFERLIALRRGRVIPGPFVKKFLEQIREGQLDRETALT